MSLIGVDPTQRPAVTIPEYNDETYLIVEKYSVLEWLEIIQNIIFAQRPDYAFPMGEEGWYWIDELPTYRKGESRNRVIKYINTGTPLDGEMSPIYISQYIDSDADWSDYPYMTNVPEGVIACRAYAMCVYAWMYEDGTIEYSSEPNGFTRIQNPFPELITGTLSLLG